MHLLTRVICSLVQWLDSRGSQFRNRNNKNTKNTLDGLWIIWALERGCWWVGGILGAEGGFTYESKISLILLIRMA